MKDVYADNFEEIASYCLSALNGVVSSSTTKNEKVNYGFVAMRHLAALAYEWNGVVRKDQCPKCNGDGYEVDDTGLSHICSKCNGDVMC